MLGIALRRHFIWSASALALACLLQAGCGGGDDEVAPPPANRFAYASNTSGSSVSSFTIDAASGQIQPVAGSPFSTGVDPFQVSISPSGKHLYVATNGLPPYDFAAGGAVYGYAINKASGALTPIPGSPFAAGDAPTALAFGNAGTYLYAANAASGDITAFSVNLDSGALTPVGGSPFIADASPQSIAVSPDGKFVLVANGDADTLSVFTINTATGALAPVAGTPLAAGDFPYRIAFGAGGKFVFVSNAGSDSATGGATSLSAYSLNASTGALVELTGSPFALSINGYIASDRTGSFLYVPAVGGLSAFTIDTTTGALGVVAGSPFSTGSDPTFVGIESSGKFLYLTDCAGGVVEGYAITPLTGALTRLAGPPVMSGACPLFLATS